MENVTFVSNSHQRPAADNLQKLKSLLTNTRQQIKSQTQQVTIKNLYVSSFTLVCFRSGKPNFSPILAIISWCACNLLSS